MKKKIPAKKIEHSKYKIFFKIAENFKNGAELAFEFEYYNAAGVLLIHSAIAFADAISIKYSSNKCSGDNHYEIIAYLKEILPPSAANKRALLHLKNLIDHKNRVSYSGDIYHRSDIVKLNKMLARFTDWANSILIS